MMIGSYDDSVHRKGVISLWKEVFGYSDKRNNPALVIDKKLEQRDNLFFVAVQDASVLGTVMAGYDGHRGWIYSLAVHPDSREKRLGSELLQHAEEALADLGCMKVNLQILSSNSSVRDFYLKRGYSEEERISMGKQITRNIPD